MKKRTTYDLGLKIMVTNEYADGNATYSSLSEKYGVPSPTIAKWIQRSKRHNNGSLITKQESRDFLDVTNALQTTIKTPETVTIVVNGLELKSDLNTFLRLLQGAKHV